MPKNAAGRNDPCPCGSGKKYKKCCLVRDEVQAPNAGHSHDHKGCSPHDHLRAGVLHLPAGLTEAQAREYVQRLDRWSHAGLDAFDQGRLEEAERIADQLRTEYPDQIDGEQLRAKVRLQQQRWEEAALGFEKAVVIALKYREDYDDEFIENLRREAEHAHAQAKGPDVNPGPSHNLQGNQPAH